MAFGPIQIPRRDKKLTQWLKERPEGSGAELLPGIHRTLRELEIDSGLETSWEQGPVQGLA